MRFILNIRRIYIYITLLISQPLIESPSALTFNIKSQRWIVKSEDDSTKGKIKNELWKMVWVLSYKETLIPAGPDRRCGVAWQWRQVEELRHLIYRRVEYCFCVGVARLVSTLGFISLIIVQFLEETYLPRLKERSKKQLGFIPFSYLVSLTPPQRRNDSFFLKHMPFLFSNTFKCNFYLTRNKQWDTFFFIHLFRNFKKKNAILLNNKIKWLIRNCFIISDLI